MISRKPIFCFLNLLSHQQHRRPGNQTAPRPNNPNDPLWEDCFKSIIIAYQTLSHLMLHNQHTGLILRNEQGGRRSTQRWRRTDRKFQRFIYFPSFFSYSTLLLESTCPCRNGIQTSQKPQMQTQHIHWISYKSIRYKSLHLLWPIHKLMNDQFAWGSWPLMWILWPMPCISFVSHHLTTNWTLVGAGGWLHDVQGKYHVFSEMYVHCAFSFCFFLWAHFDSISILWAAIELKSVSDNFKQPKRKGT